MGHLGSRGRGVTAAEGRIGPDWARLGVLSEHTEGGEASQIHRGREQREVLADAE